MSAAKDRIDGLIELAPRVAQTPRNRAEFDQLEGEIDELLTCESCGAGCLEEAQDNRTQEECDECTEFADLWDEHADDLLVYEE